MALKHFKEFDALSSAVPDGDSYRAVIAVKRRDSDDTARVHQVANDQHYDLAFEAEAAAEAALVKVVEVDDSGELIYEPNAE